MGLSRWLAIKCGPYFTQGMMSDNRYSVYKKGGIRAPKALSPEHLFDRGSVPCSDLRIGWIAACRAAAILKLPVEPADAAIKNDSTNTRQCEQHRG